MKTKEFKKKLVLNQETIADLDNEKMDSIRGGRTAMDTCHTFCDANPKLSICICEYTNYITCLC